MVLSLASVLALAGRCAPAIAPETLLPIVQVESGLDPLAIGVNGQPRTVVTAASAADAIAKASALIAAGQSVDLGLAQINSRNLARLGLSVADAFDPCHNLRAAARVLQVGYVRSAVVAPDEQTALRTALSYYNTGDPRRGFDNGYVAKVTSIAIRRPPSAQTGPHRADIRPDVSPTSWDVFARVPSAVFVISPANNKEISR
jgi:type IV secretion system protein VirB1